MKLGLLLISLIGAVAADSVSVRAAEPYGSCRSGRGLNPAISSLAYDSGSSDEFSGTKLNSELWHDINPGWVGRDIGKFHASQVAVGNGRLILSTSVNRLDDEPVALVLNGTVLSKSTFRYGYFETRAKTARNAVSSSFWFYRDEPDYWTEIDVFETGGIDRVSREIRTNAHVFRLPGQPKIANSGDQRVLKVDHDLRTTWTVYGMYWTDRNIEFYINGCLRRTISNTVFHQALNAVFDMEVFKDWMGNPDMDQLPAKFEVDYFRVWR